MMTRLIQAVTITFTLHLLMGMSAQGPSQVASPSLWQDVSDALLQVGDRI